MYDRTGLSTKCTLIKTGFKNARTGTKAKFRPFVDALTHNKQKVCQPSAVSHTLLNDVKILVTQSKVNC